MHHHKRHLKHLATAAVHAGFGKLLHDFNLLHHLPYRVFRKRDAFAHASADGRALTRTLEELGPGFVEAGRIVASRSDIIPRPYQSALLNSNAALPVMSHAAFTKLLRRAIGRDGMAAIASIETALYRSNPVSETRKAIFKNGKRALITVNDPKAAYLLGRNLESIRALAPAVRTKFSHIVFENCMEELERRAGLLSDLSAQASRLEMLNAQFERHQKITIPEVLWEYTSRDALVQRWHNYPSMREIASGSKKTGAAGKYINRYVAEAFAYQYGLGGVFVLRPLLSDMQIAPGNTVVISHALATGYMEPEERRQFVAILYALLEGETELAAKVLLAGHYAAVRNHSYFASGIQVPAPRKGATISEALWELLEQAWHGNLHVALDTSMAAESVLYLEHAFSRFDREASLADNMRLAIKKYIPEMFGVKKTATVKEIVLSAIKAS